MIRRDKGEEGTAHTFGQYDTVRGDADFVHLVTHGPIIENLGHVGRKTEPEIPAWLCGDNGVSMSNE